MVPHLLLVAGIIVVKTLIEDELEVRYTKRLRKYQKARNWVTCPECTITERVPEPVRFQTTFTCLYCGASWEETPTHSEVQK